MYDDLMPCQFAFTHMHAHTHTHTRNVLQEPLPPHIKQEILVELCTPDRLRDALMVY